MPVSHTSPYAGIHDDPVAIHHISIPDVFAALRRGASDFWRHPSHYLFLALIYPAVGIVLGVWSAGGAMFALLYPLATGFALLGPFAAIGLYELSRRREAGLDDSPRHAFAVLRHPSIMSILLVGLWLALMFAAWIASAAMLYDAFLGSRAIGLNELITLVLTTPEGRSLLIWGNLVGLAFALIVLATTAIAFPLLVDRGGSAGHAISTSLLAFRTNPIPMLAWGLIVAIVLFIASIPLFVGLAVALPILGHATWHLYRRLTA